MFKGAAYLNLLLIAQTYFSGSEYTSFSVYYFNIFENKNYIINILLVIVLAIMTLIAKFAKFSMHKILRSCANDCIAKNLLIRCSGVAVLRKICFQVNALSCNRW